MICRTWQTLWIEAGYKGWLLELRLKYVCKTNWCTNKRPYRHVLKSCLKKVIFWGFFEILKFCPRIWYKFFYIIHSLHKNQFLSLSSVCNTLNVELRISIVGEKVLIVASGFELKSMTSMVIIVYSIIKRASQYSLFAKPVLEVRLAYRTIGKNFFQCRYYATQLCQNGARTYTLWETQWCAQISAIPYERNWPAFGVCSTIPLESRQRLEKVTTLLYLI